MTEELFRVMYRSTTDGAWSLHSGSKGTTSYGSVGAARGAVTQFRKQTDRWQMYRYEYKIQRAPVGEWEDIA